MRKLTRLMGIPDLLNKVNIGPNRSIFTLLHVAYSAIHHCKKNTSVIGRAVVWDCIRLIDDYMYSMYISVFTVSLDSLTSSEAALSMTASARPRYPRPQKRGIPLKTACMPFNISTFPGWGRRRVNEMNRPN